MKNKWRSTITKERKTIHLGYFASEIEAFMEYATKAKEIGFSNRHIYGDGDKT